MNALERMGIAQTARCKQARLTISEAAELNTETMRMRGEQDCLRGLEPQDGSETYQKAYGKMYERLEKMDWLTRMVS